MATETLRVIVDDLLSTMRQTFDDKQITRAQVAYWVTIVGNQLLGQHIVKRDSGQFLTTFANVPIKTASTNATRNIIAKRKYVDLPHNIFDFDRDNGVEYIAYYNEAPEDCEPEFQKKTIQRTTPSEIQWLRLNPYTKPSLKNPYWYRSSGIIYLVGLEQSNIKEVEMGIYMTIDPLVEIDIDQPFPFPAELLHILKRQVLDLSRFSFLYPASSINDGTDNNATANIAKAVSVNDVSPEQAQQQQ